MTDKSWHEWKPIELPPSLIKDDGLMTPIESIMTQVNDNIFEQMGKLMRRQSATKGVLRNIPARLSVVGGEYHAGVSPEGYDYALLEIECQHTSGRSVTIYADLTDAEEVLYYFKCVASKELDGDTRSYDIRSEGNVHYKADALNRYPFPTSEVDKLLSTMIVTVETWEASR